MFNADPTLYAVDPPNGHDPGVMNVITRYVMPIPFKLVATLLGDEWSPRDFFMMVYPQLVARGLQVVCEALVNWMCISCTTRAAGEMISRAGHEAANVPRLDQVLREHRHLMVLARLPSLSLGPTTVAGTQVANVLSQLVQEQRAARQDATTRADTSEVKTAANYYGPTLHAWMRLAQVGDEAMLPPIHTDLAKNGRKRARDTWQQHMTHMAFEQGWTMMRIVVSPSLAERLNSAQFWSNNPDDLSIGINMFQIGGSTIASISTLEDHARAFDTARVVGAGTFEEISSVVNDKMVELPLTHHQAESQCKAFYLLLVTVFGAGHVATVAMGKFLRDMRHNFERWMMYAPRAPDHASLGPVLACQQFRMYFNLWVQQQREVATAVPFPHEVHDIWSKITLGDPTWEKPLPAVYVRSQPRGQPAGAPPAAAPAGVPANAGGALQPRGPFGGERQTVHVNMHPNPILTLYKDIKGARTFKSLIEQGEPVPSNDRGVPMCLSFHIWGCATVAAAEPKTTTTSCRAASNILNEKIARSNHGVRFISCPCPPRMAVETCTVNTVPS
jgi:hypothetical protein